MTSPQQAFKDARSKAQRAKGHIYKLIDEYRALANSDLTRLVIEDDFEPGQQRIKAIRITDFPPNVPLIIGDAVHNLRTAFDYIMIALTGEERMALPVGKLRDDIILKSEHYRTIKASHLATLIIDEIQPYYRGQFLLWELSELDRIDKHRLILPTISQAYRLGVRLEDQGGEPIFGAPWFTVGDNFATTQTFRGPIKIHNEGDSALSVSFGPGTPFEGEAVLETLDKLSKLALQAIERFERFCFGGT